MSQEEIQSIELTDDQLEDVSGGTHHKKSYGLGIFNETINTNETNQFAVAGGDVTQFNATSQS